MKKWSERTHGELALRVSVVSIAVNVILSLFKLAAGIFARSGAMLSDAVHSLSDVLSTLVVIAGVKLSERASDKGHPYGHERLECVASILLAGMLALTGAGIGLAGARSILSSAKNELQVPGALALAAAVVSILIKEAMYWYTRAAARRVNSGALMADAWHHRSDALSSVGSFAGILGARLGLPVLDPIASVVICLFILKVSYDIFMDAVRKMTDEAVDESTVSAMRETVLAQAGVDGVERLDTRKFGNRVYVEAEITCKGDMTVTQAHAVADSVHDAIERGFPSVKHCMVHVSPDPLAAE